ncbi:hypothetical protein A3G67_04680 [Candidatus Roizmanbacteria bacterium RIFCSPLOWO2_12_FULL_40_12]|uniref:Purple acid phosphatase N-terminal domain-containing protein n=1 Tax=Candidatus Roizmanbacteria bacterium RIFCSPLOWO2_01_FULL_40_42 TaxID=1802066 RepID=A0A1F7J4N9_9BACT|nr:MAG: hypothetical protein A2779_04470 [Candidatus Roizmanbacteria bacterium RIFCSPHIGHO2_01_FULL_40_98]OGK27329.1 MAG: hypothetical protein A3C31_04795 [Candidatus Roizmanbacteria bacterium RIFCSPHIGHO2_02_FULL_40_53]OGK30799.1 MAG: hypothetical protein A2W49_02245 [Candidatus Roizmanbacteria bacterium RIFCSPHIGHO2_12_41_18]OGK36434.1 MAG: hypothetical protein A3E69_02420 [Candidatus Roizmanbacteria bacterium RIFCSPHIGHO2_12_FULL_40_130]OGK50562.1 MAG: hypothetical protein A3B50_02150 [Candi
MTSFTDIYSRKEVQIPTWLSFAVVIVVVVFVSIVFFRSEPPSSRATKKVIKNVEVTNLSSSQVAIFWQTEQKEPGWIAYGSQENKLNQIALDERDFQDSKTARLTHYVILKNLTPSNEYFFKLVNNKELIANPEGRAFSLSTLPRTSRVSNLKPAYGKVTDSNGAPLDNVIVLLSANNAYLLSALSKASGEWLIPLNYIIDKKTGALKVLSKDEVIKIELFSDNGNRSSVQTNISNLSPLPETIILGKNYNLNKKENVLSVTDDKRVKIEILFPRENAIVPGSTPLIRGTGIPNSNLSAVVTDTKKDTTVKTKIGGDGFWSISLASPLSAGKHTLTVRTPDTNGKETLLTRNFSIAKSGEQVLGEATGAAIPTASPSPTIIANTTPTPPVSGVNTSLLVFSSLSLVTIGMWLLVFAL